MTGIEHSERELARRVHDCCHLTGEFTLRSGATATEYFDKYLFEADPVLLREIAEAMLQRIPGDVEALAGLELGGVPLVTVLSQLSGLPARFVRKQPKRYGTCRLAEGGEIADTRLAVVEDVITSGGQAMASIRALRDLGATVQTVLCVIDREADGAHCLAAEGVELRALFTTSTLADVVREGAPHTERPS